MSLKKCKECDAKVSNKAKTCPHCGVENPTGKLGLKSIVKGFVGLIFLYLLYLIVFDQGSEREKLGLPEVHQKIEAMTDCGELQKSFDRNSDDHDRRTNSDDPNVNKMYIRKILVSYMHTIDKRMKEVGCYQ